MKIPTWKLVGKTYGEALDHDAAEVECGECHSTVDANEYREHRDRERASSDD